MRRDIYASFDQLVAQQTRFFGAAARTVEYLANGDIPGSNWIGPSSEAQSFLKQVSASLYALNAAALKDIISGRLSGPGLDDRLINMEQSRVQSMLNALSPESRSSITQSINAAFSSRVASLASGGTNSSDRAYNQVLSGVVKALGRPIDFGKQGDREAIGKALVRELRKDGACTTTGSRLSQC